jgi:peptidoglycan/LPS O-acetylase OafA/YrhL
MAYGLLVLWAVANPAKCAMLCWGWVQWIGASSYSIFPWQQLFTGKANLYKGWTISALPLLLVPILACAALSYYLIERPTIRISRSIQQSTAKKAGSCCYRTFCLTC